MKRWNVFVVAVACVMAVTEGVAFGEDAQRPVPEAVAANFARLDHDGDKQLSSAEFRAANAAAQVAVALRDFELFDRDADGFLSLNEYWSLPTGVSANQRGPLSDPMAEIVTQFVAILDQLLKDWDKTPERMVPVAEFLAEFSKALQEPQTALMRREADPDRDGQVSRAEARRFVEIQAGVRRSDGKLLREPDGRVYHTMHFVHADQDRDDRLDQAEFLARAYFPPGKGPESFEQLDTDKDQFVSWLEWCKGRFLDPINEFRHHDVNLDGQLEAAELQAATPEWCRISSKVAFPAFDRDRSGKLSLDEYRLTFHMTPIARWHEMLSDTDDDGLISRQEFAYGGVYPLMRYVYFEMLDANHDGLLDSQEFLFTRKTPNAVYSLNADGTGWKKLFDVKGYPAIGSPAVSPDGKLVAFDGHKAKEGHAAQTMFVTNLDGSHLQNVGLGMMPTWSGDGTELTCSRNRPQYGLWVVSADGKNERFLRDGWGAQWSPDGRRILFSDYRVIMTYDLATEKTTNHFDAVASGYQHVQWNMAWSPDSKRVCFKGVKQNLTEEVGVVWVDGGEPRLKVHYSGKNVATDFGWHPKGDRVLFCMYCIERKNLQLYEFNPNTDDPPKLVNGQDEKSRITSPCWTPDGKQLIVITGDY